MSSGFFLVTVYSQVSACYLVFVYSGDMSLIACFTLETVLHKLINVLFSDFAFLSFELVQYFILLLPCAATVLFYTLQFFF
jgi:hypothetical protein